MLRIDAHEISNEDLLKLRDVTDLLNELSRTVKDQNKANMLADAEAILQAIGSDIKVLRTNEVFYVTCYDDEV